MTSKQQNTSSSSIRGLALLSGFLGSTASCFAKLAFGATETGEQHTQHALFSVFQLSACNNRTSAEGLLNDSEVWRHYSCDIIQFYLPRGLCIVAVVVCNAVMLGSFLEGMEESGSVAATGLSTAANFVASAAYGFVLWEEELMETKWLLGFFMVMAGVILLSTVKSEETQPQKQEQNQSSVAEKIQKKQA